MACGKEQPALRRGVRGDARLCSDGALDGWSPSAQKDRRTQAHRLAFQRPAGQVRPRQGGNDSLAANAKQTDPLCTIPQPHLIKMRTGAPQTTREGIPSAYGGSSCRHSLHRKSEYHFRTGEQKVSASVPAKRSACPVMASAVTNTNLPTGPSERREPSQGQTSQTREQGSARPRLRPRRISVPPGPWSLWRELGEAERARTISADRSLLLNRTSPRGPRVAMLA